MGLLDSVIGALGQTAGGGGGLSGGGSAQQAALINAVQALLSDSGGAGSAGGLGGLGGLVSKLQQGGLGDVVSSWVSTGQNLPVSAGQLHAALGSDVLGPLARQLGLGEGDLAGGLAGLLPHVVDGLTPDGKMPSAGAAPDLAGLVGSLLRR